MPEQFLVDSLGFVAELQAVDKHELESIAAAVCDKHAGLLVEVGKSTSKKRVAAPG